MNELSGEEWYDAELAPKLLELADRCRERGIAMVATVEYAPGDRGTTMALPDGAGLAMQMLRLCANAGENVDGYMISLLRFCAANEIDVGRSMFLRGRTTERASTHDARIESMQIDVDEIRALRQRVKELEIDAASPKPKPEGCNLGCTQICQAKEHGCASECPALPWQPEATNTAVEKA